MTEKKCWMVHFDDEFCEPVWASSEAEATLQANLIHHVPESAITELRRIPAWDGRDYKLLRSRDWLDLGEGYGYRCVLCDEMVYEEVDTPWFTLAGDVVHGPYGEGWECFSDYASEQMLVSRETLEALEQAFGHDALVYALNDWPQPNRWQRVRQWLPNWRLAS